MIRVNQTFGAHAGRVLEFHQEVIRCGRLPDSELCFDAQADLDASGRHAEIRLENGHYFVVDVGSRNGTLLNNVPVQRGVLKSGDEIEFGTGGPRVRVEIVLASSPSVAHGAPYNPAGATPRSIAPQAWGAVRIESANGIPSPSASPSLGQSWPQSGALPSSDIEPTSSGARPHSLRPVPPPPQYPGFQGAPEPAGAPPPRPVGSKTVAMMIEGALAQSRAESERGASRSTAFFKAMAAEASVSKRLKVVVAILVTMLLLSLCVVGFLIWKLSLAGMTPKEESVELQSEVLAKGPGPERAAIETRLAQINVQVLPALREKSQQIESSKSLGVYLVSAKAAGSATSTALCTAFAVRADLLATSARCIARVEAARARGETLEAVPNHGRGTRLPIVQLWRHPQANPAAPASVTPGVDVGLLQIRGLASVLLTPATMDEATALAEGDDVFVYGFSGADRNIDTPRAQLSNGVVGRLGLASGQPADDPTRAAVFLQSASLHAPGSPIMTADGIVIGIASGDPMDERGPPHWATRVDHLVGLLVGMGR